MCDIFINLGVARSQNGKVFVIKMKILHHVKSTGALTFRLLRLVSPELLSWPHYFLDTRRTSISLIGEYQYVLYSNTFFFSLSMFCFHFLHARTSISLYLLSWPTLRYQATSDNRMNGTGVLEECMDLSFTTTKPTGQQFINRILWKW